MFIEVYEIKGTGGTRPRLINISHISYIIPDLKDEQGITLLGINNRDIPLLIKESYESIRDRILLVSSLPSS